MAAASEESCLAEVRACWSERVDGEAGTVVDDEAAEESAVPDDPDDEPDDEPSEDDPDDEPDDESEEDAPAGVDNEAVGAAFGTTSDRCISRAAVVGTAEKGTWVNNPEAVTERRSGFRSRPARRAARKVEFSLQPLGGMTATPLV